MLTLAFESSAKAASAALVRDGELFAQSIQCSGLTHSRTLLPMAEDMLKNTGVSLKDKNRAQVSQRWRPWRGTGFRRAEPSVQ